MSRMSELMFDIEHDLVNTDLDNAQIAQKHNVPIAWVYEVADELQSYAYDELERDHDEPYEPDTDTGYSDDQYDF